MAERPIILKVQADENTLKRVLALLNQVDNAQDRVGDNPGLTNLGAKSNAVASALSSLPGPLGRVGSEFANVQAKASLLEGVLGRYAPLAGVVAGALVAVGAALVGVAVAAQQATVAVQTFADFEQKMSAVKAVTASTEEQFSRLSDVAEDLGARTSFSASEAAVGMAELAKAGLGVDQVIGAIPATLDLARAGELELGRAAEVTSNIMNTFGLSADKTRQIVDILAAVALKSSTDVGAVGDAMKYVGSSADVMGISLEDTAAALALLAQKGQDGSTAGTGLRRMLSELADPTKKAREELQRLGISIESVNPVTNDLETVLRNLRPVAQNAASSFVIFSDKAASIVPILAADINEFEKFQAITHGADGTAQAFAKTMQDNLKGSLEELSGATEAARISFGRMVEPTVTTIIEKLTVVIRDAVPLFGELGESAALLANGLASIAELSGELELDGFTDQVRRFNEELKAGMPALEWTIDKLERYITFRRTARDLGTLVSEGLPTLISGGQTTAGARLGPGAREGASAEFREAQAHAAATKAWIEAEVARVQGIVDANVAEMDRKRKAAADAALAATEALRDASEKLASTFRTDTAGAIAVANGELEAFKIAVSAGFESLEQLTPAQRKMVDELVVTQRETKAAIEAQELLRSSTEKLADMFEQRAAMAIAEARGELEAFKVAAAAGFTSLDQLTSQQRAGVDATVFEANERARRARELKAGEEELERFLDKRRKNEKEALERELGAEEELADFRNQAAIERDEKAAAAVVAQKEAAATTAEAWFRAAQIMGDAVVGAFGEMGNKVSSFVNQIVQLIGLMQQFAEIARATSAGGAGGGGFLGGLGQMFGFGGGGGPAPYSQTANHYFNHGGWGADPTTRGAGFSWGGAGGGALMGLGIGTGVAGVGSMFGIGGRTHADGSSADYSAEGGAVGGAIGGAIAGGLTGGLGAPVGALIGGAIGTIAGSFIKKGADTALGAIDAHSGSFNLSSSQGKAGEALRKVGDSIAEGIAGFEELIGAQFAKVGGIGLKFRGGEFSVFGGGEAFRTKDESKAIEEGLFRAIKNADFTGIADNIAKAIQSPLSSSLETLSANVEVALAIEDLALPDLNAAFANSIKALEALRTEGIKLGLDVGNVNRAIVQAWQDRKDEILGVQESELVERVRMAQDFNEKLSAERARGEASLASLVADLAAAQSSSVEISGEAVARLSELGIGVEELAAATGKSTDELERQIAAAREVLSSLPDLIDADELSKSISLAFGGGLLDFVETYYGKVAAGENLRANLEQLNFEIRLASLRIEFETLKALGALSAETLAQAERVFGFIDSHAPAFDPENLRDPAREREERQRRRTEEFEGAKGTLAGTLERSRLQFEEYGKAIDILNDRLRTGAISAEEHGRRIAEFGDEMFVGFGGDLMSFVDQYYGESKEGEALRLAVAQASHEIQLANLKIQFEGLKALGVLSAEQVALIQGTLDKISTLEIDWGIFEEEEKTPVERWLDRVADAASDPSFDTAASTLLGIFDRVFAMLPEGSMVNVPVITGWRSGPGPSTSREGSRDLGRDGDEIIEPLIEWSDKQVTVEEARFELNKTMMLLELQVYEAQLKAAGAWDSSTQKLFDGVRGVILDLEYAGETIVNTFEEWAAGQREQQKSAKQSFEELFEKLTGSEEEQSAEARIREDFEKLFSFFRSSSSYFQAAFLKDHGVEGITPGDSFNAPTINGKSWATAGEEIAEAFRKIMEPFLQKKIDELDDADDGKDRIREFFDDLRFGEAGQSTRERFENVLSGFNSALAEGDLNKATELARLLVGEVGQRQFGGSTQDFRDFRDSIVTALGGQLPEGVPQDLLYREQQESNRRLVNINLAITTQTETLRIAFEGGLERIARSISDLASELARRPLATAPAGSFR